MDIALRLDVKRCDALTVIEKLKEKFNPSQSLWAYEIKTTSKIPHIHGYFKADMPFKNDKAKQRWINKELSKFKQQDKMWYYIKPVEDLDKYMIYLLKDLDVLEKDIPDELYESWMSQTKRVNEEKKLSTLSKMLNFITENEIETETVYQCRKAALQWYLSIDKFPHNRNILMYYGNQIYHKRQKPSLDLLMANCFNLNEDTQYQKSINELERLKLLLKKQNELEEEIKNYESDSESELSDTFVNQGI